MMNQVFDNIKRLGGSCYFTGQCVRDKLLSRQTSDIFDVIVLRMPKDVILTSLIGIGCKPVLDGNIIRVEYEKSKYNFIILDEDEFQNRTNNFTIDLILVDCFTGKVQDPFKGVDDLKNKILRLTNSKALLEQPELMLDACILTARLGFKLSVDTWFSIYDNARLIKMLSMDKLRSKLIELLSLDKPSDAFKLLQSTGILVHILPEVSACENVIQSRREGVKNVFEHIMYALDASENDINIRLAVLFHDIGKADTMECAPDGTIHFFRHEIVGADMAKRRMKELNFSQKIVSKISHLILHHMFDPDPKLTEKGIRRLIRKVGEDNIHDLIKLKEADRQGAPEKISMKKIKLLKSKIAKELSKKNGTVRNSNATTGSIVL